MVNPNFLKMPQSFEILSLWVFENFSFILYTLNNYFRFDFCSFNPKKHHCQSWKLFRDTFCSTSNMKKRYFQKNVKFGTFPQVPDFLFLVKIWERLFRYEEDQNKEVCWNLEAGKILSRRQSWENIWNKVKKWSKIERDQKTFLTTSV